MHEKEPLESEDEDNNEFDEMDQNELGDIPENQYIIHNNKEIEQVPQEADLEEEIEGREEVQHKEIQTQDHRIESEDDGDDENYEDGNIHYEDEVENQAEKVPQLRRSAQTMQVPTIVGKMYLRLHRREKGKYSIKMY